MEDEPWDAAEEIAEFLWARYCNEQQHKLKTRTAVETKPKSSATATQRASTATPKQRRVSCDSTRANRASAGSSSQHSTRHVKRPATNLDSPTTAEPSGSSKKVRTSNLPQVITPQNANAVVQQVLKATKAAPSLRGAPPTDLANNSTGSFKKHGGEPTESEYCSVSEYGSVDASLRATDLRQELAEQSEPPTKEDVKLQHSLKRMKWLQTRTDESRRFVQANCRPGLNATVHTRDARSGGVEASPIEHPVYDSPPDGSTKRNVSEARILVTAGEQDTVPEAELAGEARLQNTTIEREETMATATGDLSRWVYSTKTYERDDRFSDPPRMPTTAPTTNATVDPTAQCLVCDAHTVSTPQRTPATSAME